MGVRERVRFWGDEGRYGCGNDIFVKEACIARSDGAADKIVSSIFLGDAEIICADGCETPSRDGARRSDLPKNHGGRAVGDAHSSWD